VRYRTETHHRWVPHTVDGITELVPEEYTERIPVPPRDWDHIVLTAVTAAVTVILGACIVWSTASIGDLLARAVYAPIAYAAAVTCSLAWVTCMALEWLARYEPDRARGPRRAGHVALALDMAAVCVHGQMADSLRVGIAGAVISGIAKGLWSLVLSFTARPLDPRTRAWLVQRQSGIGARLALAAQLRHLERMEARTPIRTVPDTVPDRTASAPDRPDEEESSAIAKPMTVKDAVRTAMDSGTTDPDAILRYVRTRADANAKPATVDRYIRLARLAG
jgi:hypothetical protein